MIRSTKETQNLPNSNLSFVSLYLFILILFLLLSRISHHSSPDDSFKRLVSSIKSQDSVVDLKNIGKIVMLHRPEISYRGCLMAQNKLCKELVDMINLSVSHLHNNKQFSNFRLKIENGDTKLSARDIAIMLRELKEGFDARINLEFIDLNTLNPLYINIVRN